MNNRYYIQIYNGQNWCDYRRIELNSKQNLGINDKRYFETKSDAEKHIERFLNEKTTRIIKEV